MKNKLNDISENLGRLPPQNLDAEMSILGAMLLERDAVTTIIDLIRPDTFYKEAHGIIFASVVCLYGLNEPIDLITVSARLKKMGELEKVGGVYSLAELTNRVNSSDNIETHCRIILECSMKREMIHLASKLQASAYDDTEDVFDMYSSADLRLNQVIEQNTRGSFIDFNTAISNSIQKWYESKNIELTGVPSGFTNLDRATGGFQNSELIIIAARPGMGKTAFVVSCLVNSAKLFKTPVALFSLEMSINQLNQRIVSSESNIPLSVVKFPKSISDHQWNQIQATRDKIVDLPIFIDDTPSLSIIELRAKARRMKKKHGIKLIVVDYLQLMTGNQKGNREQEISSIARSLKGLAKELDIPVIALSQLSRAVETRGGDKRPQLSDLRESGAIEQDADMVIFLYRPEYYDISEDEAGNSVKGKGEVILAKNRQGSLDSVFLDFDGAHTKWKDDEVFVSTQFPVAKSNFENEKPEGSAPF